MGKSRSYLPCNKRFLIMRRRRCYLVLGLPYMLSTIMRDNSYLLCGRHRIHRRRCYALLRTVNNRVSCRSKFVIQHRSHQLCRLSLSKTKNLGLMPFRFCPMTTCCGFHMFHRMTQRPTQRIILRVCSNRNAAAVFHGPTVYRTLHQRICVPLYHPSRA